MTGAKCQQHNDTVIQSLRAVADPWRLRAELGANSEADKLATVVVAHKHGQTVLPS